MAVDVSAPVRQCVLVPQGNQAAGRAVAGSRLACVDLLRGLAMVVMALDHTRDFFSGLPYAPEDLAHTTAPLFFARFITHFCATIFFLLAGSSAYLSLGKDRPVDKLARFLWTRGLFLVVLELTVVSYGWTYLFGFWFSGTLWALGWSMVALGFLVRLRVSVIAAMGAAIVAGAGLLDGVDPAIFGKVSWLWMILFGHGSFTTWNREARFFVLWPLLPWAGVMALGYALGAVLRKGHWRKPVAAIGAALTLGFIILRTFHLYGNGGGAFEAAIPDASGSWRLQGNLTLSTISFFNTLKYPPSLQFLLMTGGPSLILLAWFDKIRARSRVSKLLSTFGQVPLFFYVVHIYAIHALAVWIGFLYSQRIAWLLYGGFMLQTPPSGYGHSLPFVYAVWIAIVLLLYSPCKWFLRLKRERRDWRWLRYV